MTSPRRMPLPAVALALLSTTAPVASQLQFGPHQGPAFFRAEPSSIPGETLHLHLRAEALRPVLIGLSGAASTVHTRFGKLWLGQNAAFPLAMATDTGGRARLTLPITARSGIEAYLQAVVVHPSYTATLSNLVRVKTGGAPLVWSDDFESHRAGAFPGGSWRFAVGNRQIAVDATTAGQGRQSLRVVGGSGCWSAGALHPIDPARGLYANDFTFEFMFRLGDNRQVGCHRWFRAMVGNGARNVLLGRPNGQLSLAGVKATPAVKLMTWHRLRARQTRISDNEVRLVYHLDGKFVAEAIVPKLAKEERATTVHFTSAEGPVWFDDVKLWSGFGPR